MRGLDRPRLDRYIPHLQRIAKRSGLICHIVHSYNKRLNLKKLTQSPELLANKIYGGQKSIVIILSKVTGKNERQCPYKLLTHLVFGFKEAGAFIVIIKICSKAVSDCQPVFVQL